MSFNNLRCILGLSLMVGPLYALAESQNSDKYLIEQCQNLQKCAAGNQLSAIERLDRVDAAIACVKKIDDSTRLLNSHKNKISNEINNSKREELSANEALLANLRSRIEECQSQSAANLKMHSQALDVAISCGEETSDLTDKRNNRLVQLAQSCRSLNTSLQMKIASAKFVNATKGFFKRIATPQETDAVVEDVVTVHSEELNVETETAQVDEVVPAAETVVVAEDTAKDDVAEEHSATVVVLRETTEENLPRTETDVAGHTAPPTASPAAPAPDRAPAPAQASREPAAIVNSVQARSALSGSSNAYVGLLTHYASAQQEQIGALIQRRNSDLIDSGDRRVVQNYYNDVRQAYIARPVSDLANRGVPEALAQYVRSVRSSFASTGPNTASEIAQKEDTIAELRLRLDGLERGDSDRNALVSEISKLNSELRELKTRSNQSKEVAACIVNRADLSHLNNQSRIAAASIENLMAASSASYNIQTLENFPRWTNNDRTDLSNALKAFEEGRLQAIVEECCKGDRACETANKDTANRIDGELAQKMHDATQNAPQVGLVPNPASISELSAKDLVDIIADKKSTFASLRQGTKNDDYVDEMDVFESMARCRIRATRYQSDRVPVSKQAISAIGQTIKCGILPFWATQNWDTKWQQLSTGIAAAEVRGQGWDMSCDPREMEAWNAVAAQGRDPNNWGLAQMANPPYLQSMRQIPPISTGLPGSAMTADDFLMMTPAPGLNALETQLDSRTAVQVANASSGARLGARQVGQGSGSLLAAQVARSNRGVTQGQGLVQAVRTSSSEIRNGKQPEFYSERMRTGARQTNEFLATSVSRVQSLSSSDRARESAQTDLARNQVLRSVGTSASRSTSEGILNGLQQGRGAPPSSVTDVGARNTAVREELKTQIQKHLNNIELTRKKGEEARAEVMRFVAEHDSVMLELETEIRGKPPSTIQSKIAAKRSELMDIVRQIGVNKAAFDSYQAAIMEQNSALHRLATFGPQNMELRVGGRGESRGRTTGSSSANGVDTSSMPAGFDPNSRGSVRGAWLQPKNSWFETVLDRLNPVANAWANSKKVLMSFEEYWASEFNRFVDQYETYVQGRRKADEANSREAAKLVAARKASITQDSYTHIDLETLISMDMFLNEMEQETDFLLEGHRTRQFVLSPAVLRDLQIAKDETIKAREAWAQAQFLGFQQAPRTYEKSPELWWGLLTQVFMQ